MNAGLPGARCVRPGRDLTLVLHGSVGPPCIAAARALARLGIEAELIELPRPPPLLLPPDVALLLASVRRTGRLACATEAGPAAGQLALLLAAHTEQLEEGLVRPLLRIVLPAEPLPPEHLVRPLLQLVAGPRAA